MRHTDLSLTVAISDLGSGEGVRGMRKEFRGVVVGPVSRNLGQKMIQVELLAPDPGGFVELPPDEPVRRILLDRFQTMQVLGTPWLS